MPKIKRYTEEDGSYHAELGFMCPGCNHRHFINDDQTKIPELTEKHIWEFNGDFENPTIKPINTCNCKH